MRTYRRRVVDDELDVLMGLPAVAIEGPKGVGKTATASERATTIIELDDARQRDLMGADPTRLDRSQSPILLDEWQRYPEVWDFVRRSVDRQPTAGRFLLTGSATPTERPTHSGAGRIVRLRMRPMSLSERGLPDVPTVSLASMLGDRRPDIDGDATLDLPAYTNEILASGFPAIHQLSPRLRDAQLDGYLERIVDAEFSELGHRVRRPTSLTAWMRAYAAATATTTAYNTILDAATPGDSDKPARSTTEVYRDVLTRLWILDPLPGWAPAANQLSRLASAPKHHLADPALAARLLSARREGLLANDTTTHMAKRDRTLLGALFESIVALSVRTYAQATDARVFHLRTKNGDHEIDLIVEGPDRRLVALEVKLSPRIADHDVQHLHWLRQRMGDLVADMAIITSGQHAYRRPDGIAVIPASLLGP